MKLNEITHLKEGGNAVKSAGVVRINKSDISATLKHIAKISKIPLKDLVTLGSVGKSDTSGDIDIALEIGKYNPTKIHATLVAAIGEDKSVYNGGTKIGSYAIPIAGDEKNGLVQVDLMYGDDVEWMTFSYWSAGDNSKYKGIIRTLLLMGVASAMNEKGTDHFEYDKNGDILIRAGRTLDLGKGLRRIFQHRPKKKVGDGNVKTLKSIPIDEFKKLFPKIKIKGDQIMITDPQQVVTVLFGKGVKPSDVETAEQIIKLIKSKFDSSMQDKILQLTKKRLGTAGKDLKLPKELTG